MKKKSNRYPGVVEREKGSGWYEINFFPFKGGKRIFKRIRAKSKNEAFDIRSGLILELKSKLGGPDTQGRDIKEFSEIWESLYGNMLADGLPRKTLLRYQKTFDRMFNIFRKENHPNIINPSGLNLCFFEEYKAYYCNTLGRIAGWRSELIVVKALVHRMHKLEFCSEDVLKKVRLVRSKKVTQKSYPEIPVSKIKEMLGMIKSQRPDFYRVIYFLLRTGRRIEETTLIEKSDVVLGDNFNPKTILVRAETTKTKTKSSLELFDDDLRSHIREAYASSVGRKAPYLFINKDGRKCNQQRVCAYLKLVSSTICGVTITPHYFRHRFLTECAKNNVSMKDAMAISGLRDLKVLITYYAHASRDGMAQVYNATKI